MFFFIKKDNDIDHTSNNSILPMENDRLREISNMSIESAMRTYNSLVNTIEQSINDSIEKAKPPHSQ